MSIKQDRKSVSPMVVNGRGTNGRKLIQLHHKRNSDPFPSHKPSVATPIPPIAPPTHLKAKREVTSKDSNKTIPTQSSIKTTPLSLKAQEVKTTPQIISPIRHIVKEEKGVVLGGVKTDSSIESDDCMIIDVKGVELSISSSNNDVNTCNDSDDSSSSVLSHKAEEIVSQMLAADSPTYTTTTKEPLRYV